MLPFKNNKLNFSSLSIKCLSQDWTPDLLTSNPAPFTTQPHCLSCVLEHWAYCEEVALCSKAVALLSLLFPPDSEVVESAWSPSQAALRTGLSEPPYILFWLSSTWSCSSIDSIIQKNGLSPSYVPSIVLEDENTAVKKADTISWYLHAPRLW